MRTAACVFVVVAVVCGQTSPPRLPVPSLEPVDRGGGIDRITGPYRPVPIEAQNLGESPRLSELIRAGNLYLSVRDAIALAIENNLEVEVQRLTPRIAETDVLRAEAGGAIRGVPLNVPEGPAGVGATRGADAAFTGSEQRLAAPQQFGVGDGAGLGAFGGGGFFSGPPVPAFDPALVGNLVWNRTNRPQANTFLTGADALTSTVVAGDLGLRKGFATGGSAFVGYDSTRIASNNLRQDINPNIASAAAFTFTQPLLRGFGVSVNRRFIRIARNNRDAAAFAFEQQLMTTAFNAARLYWDLVSLNEDVSVRRRTLELAERLLSDNIEQEQVGVVAPIEVTRARAEVAQARRDLTLARTRALQQQTVLKDFITRGAVDRPEIRSVNVVPTDSIATPALLPVEPVQDLVGRALSRRPDLAQFRIQVENAGISLTGSRSALLPSLDIVLSGRTNALVGQVNPLPTVSNGGVPFTRQPNPDFLGGYSTGFTQILGGRFPDYGAELRLEIPLLNRGARADYARDQFTKRRDELRLRQAEKQVRVEILNALIAVEQAQAAWEAAREARVFQEQALDAEQEKYAVGVSTNYLVIQYQRDLAAARSFEIASLTEYVQARNLLDRTTGAILDTYDISLDEAWRGDLRSLKVR